jgi:hypothetical protein
MWWVGLCRRSELGKSHPIHPVIVRRRPVEGCRSHPPPHPEEACAAGCLEGGFQDPRWHWRSPSRRTLRVLLRMRRRLGSGVLWCVSLSGCRRGWEGACPRQPPSNVSEPSRRTGRCSLETSRRRTSHDPIAQSWDAPGDPLHRTAARHTADDAGSRTAGRERARWRSGQHASGDPKQSWRPRQPGDPFDASASRLRAASAAKESEVEGRR